jgi:hypothetical protein
LQPTFSTLIVFAADDQASGGSKTIAILVSKAAVYRERVEGLSN